jgi:hypothetical protein
MKVHYHICERLPLVYIPVHNVTPYFYKMPFNIILSSASRSPKWSFQFTFSNYNFLSILKLSACLIFPICHCNNTCWRIQIIEISPLWWNPPSRYLPALLVIKEYVSEPTWQRLLQSAIFARFEVREALTNKFILDSASLRPSTTNVEFSSRLTG